MAAGATLTVAVHGLDSVRTPRVITVNAALRRCLRDPIPEIFDAARYLDAAVAAHLDGKEPLAEELLRTANIPEIREWTESLWGKNSPYVQPRGVVQSEDPGVASGARMPNMADRVLLHMRDGYHCRFCGIPVVRSEVRRRIASAYPDAVPWGRRNAEQHAAFQAMWAQYDHVVPYQRLGTNELENLLVTCAPCNFARMDYLLAEVGLLDPRDGNVVRSPWDGLERFREDESPLRLMHKMQPSSSSDPDCRGRSIRASTRITQGQDTRPEH